MVVIAVPIAFQFPLSDLWHAQTYQVSSHVAADQGGHGPGSRRCQRADHPGPAGAAGRPDRHLLDRQQRQPANPVHRVRRPNGGYSPAIKDVPAFIAGLYPPHTYTEIFQADGVYVFRHTG